MGRPRAYETDGLAIQSRFANPAAVRLCMPEFARYDAQADSRSWTAMRMIRDDFFGSPAQ